MNWYEAVREAQETGKILQMWDEQTSNWIPAPMNNFDTTRQYRAIEVTYDKSLYRPYCEDDYREFRGKKVLKKNWPVASKIAVLIFQDENYIGGVLFKDGVNVNFQELFDNYKHLDGSPCGVKIQD